MLPIAQEIFIVAAKRSPFGALNGALKDMPAIRLATLVGKALIAEGQIRSDRISSVIVGNTHPSHCYGPHIAQSVAFDCGIPATATTYTVNSLCGSGLQSIVCGFSDIRNGKSTVALCAGVDSMSRSFVNLKTDTKMMSQLAEKLNLQQNDLDTYATNSIDKWTSASLANIFHDEIIPLQLERGLFDKDEIKPRLQTQSIQSERSTEANCAGNADGAAAVVLANISSAKLNNWKPLARIVACEFTGSNQSSLPYVGAADAIMNLLSKLPVPTQSQASRSSKIEMKDIGLFQIHELSGAQVIGVLRQLGLSDVKHVNPTGGAIACGHPMAASGTRMIVHLCHELQRTKLKYGIAAASIGESAGVAILLENAYGQLTKA